MSRIQISGVVAGSELPDLLSAPAGDGPELVCLAVEDLRVSKRRVVETTVVVSFALNVAASVTSALLAAWIKDKLLGRARNVRIRSVLAP